MANYLNKLAELIHNNNIKKGFYDNPEPQGVRMFLINSEVVEALEALRIGKFADSQKVNEIHQIEDDQIFALEFKEHIKDTREDEIADALIRILDFCAFENIDIDKHVEMKLAYNRQRPYKHGKKF
jgi:NTP pyrophosphatase (non-canonical NTP hydrolase)